MPEGTYVVSRDPGNPRDVLFTLKPGATPPEDQQALHLEAERILAILRKLFPEGDPEFGVHYSRVLQTCQGGLVGASAAPALGMAALQVVKAEVVARHAGTVKNRYMRSLGRMAAYMAAPAVVVACLLVSVNWSSPMLLALSCAWAGCMAGVWVSFGARKREFGFEDLIRPETDLMAPGVRLAFAGILTLVITLGLALGAMEIRLGDLGSRDVLSNGWLAVLIGALCGVSEQALSTTVASRAAAWIGT